jgi:hypothetical protein
MRSVVSKAFGAASASTTNAEALLEGAARAGTGARALGISDEEVLAATAVTATTTGSAEKGGTQINSLLKALRKKGIEGDSLQAMLDQVAGKGMKGDKLMEYFGSEEALGGFEALQGNRAQYGEALAGISTAERTDEVTQRLQAYKDIPQLRAAQLRRRETSKAEVAAGESGTQVNLADAAIAAKETYMRAEGASDFEIWIDRKMSNMSKRFGGDIVGGVEQRASVQDFNRDSQHGKELLATLKEIRNRQAAGPVNQFTE